MIEIRKNVHITKLIVFRLLVLIRVLPEFISHNWDKLKNKLLYLYDADKDTTQYTISDLHDFTKDAAIQRVHHLANLLSSFLLQLYCHICPLPLTKTTSPSQSSLNKLSTMISSLPP